MNCFSEIDFTDFMTLSESSLGKLYKSAVEAFPLTTMRQHATGPIKIDELRITPFLGMNTLLVRCNATNENRIYQPLILFRKVNFQGNGASIIASDDNQKYNFTPLSEKTDTRVRCQCGDFHWRFNYCDWTEKTLYGNKRSRYISKNLRPSVNPTESIGICKHIMKFMEKLKQERIII